ncbi:hypothetical protein CLOM_g13447 [Closterium sp. NIES-68]|nr:hypothetical protein CLOM_g13447 [Closterium sp. NIES-68]GJP72463.1 hypothetical protein CLOP_g3195 [Closterium sp. NIES-67]GJP81897.1 hypothetical protein CLOP_g12030 [Closterium sp. NIES-67]
MDEASSHSVVLHVYDLSHGLARQLSQTLLGTAIDAVYHTGVVAYGTEYWFGAGVQRGVPGRTYFGPPMEAIRLGSTEVPRDLFEQFLADVSARYSPQRYSLLSHNCNHFSDDVAHFLLGRGIPSRILDLPRRVLSSPQGSLLAPLLQQLETTLKYGAAPHPPFPAPSPISASLSYSSPVQLLHSPPTSPPTPASTATAPEPPLHSITAPQAVGAAVVRGTRGDADGTQSGATGQAQAPHAAAATATPAAASPASAAPAASATAAVPAAAAAVTSSSASSAAAAGSADARAKEAVHAEIRREFAALMAAGGLAASEAAAAAVRRVMARYGSPAAAAAKS